MLQGERVINNDYLMILKLVNQFSTICTCWNTL